MDNISITIDYETELNLREIKLYFLNHSQKCKNTSQIIRLALKYYKKILCEPNVKKDMNESNKKDSIS